VHRRALKLCLLCFLETTDCTSDGSSGGRTINVGSPSDGLLARLAVPDACGLSLHRLLSAEAARVLSMLCNFHLLDVFSQ